MKTESNANVTTDNIGGADQEMLGAYQKFIADTVQYPEKRCRQSAAVVDGVVVGGINQLGADFAHHPEAVVGKVAGAAVLGMGVGALAALNRPAVNLGIAAAGVALGCAYAYGLAQRLGKDQQLSTALDDVWKYGDPISWKQSLQPIESSLGRESADLVLGTLGGGIGYGAGKLGMSSLPTPMRSFEFLQPAATEGIIQPSELESLVLYSKGRDQISKKDLPKKLDEIEQLINEANLLEAARESFFCAFDHQLTKLGTKFWDVSLQLYRAATQMRNPVAQNQHVDVARARMDSLREYMRAEAEYDAKTIGSDK